MSWQKYFTVVPQTQLLNNKLLQYNKDNLNDTSVSALGNKYSSFLPEIYSGNPNRIQRYVQYDQMDMDSEISSALDTLADFCSQVEEQSGVPFEIDYSDKINETEVQILQTSLKQWVKINQFNRRLWRTFRNILKYGDQFFIRDPETSELHWIDHNKVDGVKVAENEGKKPAVYLVRDLDLNLQSMTATSTQSLGQTYTGMPVLGTPIKYTAQGMPSSGLLTPAANPLTSRNGAAGSMHQYEVDARHIVHLSLSEGMDINWPFGTSILESIFKTYKQKELLEDAIIIYRIQRAPERRIFYIDVGNMPPHKAMAHIERVKNEIHQRRIPNRCLSLDTKIKLLDGRNLELKEIIEEFENGKENWVYSCDPNTGEIVPGPITWAGITKRNEKTIKLTFDNGKSVICTPDHKFPILGKGFVEAQNLKIGERMIPGYTQESDTSDLDTKKIQIFDNYTKQWLLLEELVKNFIQNHGRKINEKYKYAQQHISKMKNSANNETFTLIKDHYNKMLNESKNNSIDISKLYKSIQKDKKLLNEINRINPILHKKEIKEDFIQTAIINVGFKNYEDFVEKYQYLNHKITSIEVIDDGIDVGTITVDGNEDFHNFHTFLLECGVFTKNSGGGISIQDAAYNPLSMLEDYFFANTSDGRGSKVETLPGGECLALDTKIKLLDGRDLELQEIIKEFESGKKLWTYSCNPETGEIVPGKIDWAGVTRKNTQVVKLTFDNGETVTCTPDHKFPILGKGFVEAQDLEIGESMIPHYERQMQIHPKVQSTYTQIYDNASKQWKYVHRMVSEYFKDAPLENEILNNVLQVNLENVQNIDNNDYIEKNNFGKIRKSLNVDQKLLNKIVNYYNNGVVKQSHLIEKCNQDVEFITHLNSINEKENKHYKFKNIEKISINHFLSILAHHGYRNFDEFKEKVRYHNHKLVSIEWLEEPQDTGCITVDFYGEYHNFHTFSLSACIYTKNSIGEIDDLKYFNHKLTRGLGIPIAYMPSGPEDANVAFTDGRVGTAYIQEFRFGKRCQRLQNLISWVFDNEFKLFVKLRGIDIESNLYELRFNKPENFSKYRQIELDSAQLALISNLFDVPFLSKRFVMERYMNLNQEEMLRNERLWKEENPKKVKNLINTDDTNLGLGAIGVKSGFADITLPNEPSPDSSGLEPATGPGSSALMGGSDTGVESIET